MNLSCLNPKQKKNETQMNWVLVKDETNAKTNG